MFYMNVAISQTKTDDVIIYIHIPKTGGSTLHKAIQEHYGSRLLSISYNDLSQQQKECIFLIKEHIPFGIHTLLPQTRYRYMTVLRDPVERVISMYYYMRSKNCPDLDKRNYFEAITLDEYVSNEIHDYFSDIWHKSWTCSTYNLQTRMLAGDLKRCDLKKAINNLNSFFQVVGITERFAETLKVINKNYGWNVTSGEKENVTPDKPALKDIPDKTIRLIRSKNEMDMELYSHANLLLDKRSKAL